MEDKRKRFNVAEFISNEETPVETRTGYKVTIYNDNKAVAECGRNILIRSNGGEWREPVVEIEI